MKRIFLLSVLIALFSIPAICQEMPSDVKKNDPYYPYVKDLVDRGIDVTQGYPDGTFNGDKYTTNYEAAYLVAKMAISLRRSVTTETDVSDIRDELSWLRKEVDFFSQQPKLKNAIAYYGSLDISSKFGNLIAFDPAVQKKVLGPEVQYRLKYSIEKEMGDDASLKMNLDTMDGGFNSGQQRGFPIQLLDIEGNATAKMGLENPVNLRATIGPGTVLHTDTSGVMPSDNNTYIVRPRPMFYAGTSVSGFDVGGYYAARSVSDFGQVGTSEFTLLFGRKVGQLPLIGTTEIRSTSRYVCVNIIDPPSGPNNFHEELAFYITPSDSFSHKLLLGSSSSDSPITQYYLNYEFYLNDLMSKGTDMNFIFHSVGTDYRLPFEKLEFLPLDLFNRKILDGTMDIALQVFHPINNRFMLISTSDWIADSRGKMGSDVPGSSFTQELSLNYNASENLKLNTFYRYYFVPSRLDQFLTAVPEVSDCLGFGADYSF